MIWLFKILCIFVVLSFINGTEQPANSEGFFYAFKDKDVALPCIDRNSLCSPVEELSKGRGGIPIFMPPYKLIAMLKNSTSATAQSVAIIAKQNHKNSRASLIFDLYTRPTHKLISDFLIEVDAKNKAYFFILENGHFESFRAYCQKERSSL